MEAAAGVKTAAQRRILNELGVEAKDCLAQDMTYLTRILYASPSSGQWGEHELDYILFLRAREGGITVTPNPNEVKDIEYVPRTELNDFLREKKKVGITPWFELIANSMLPVWWQNLDRLEEHQDHKKIKRFK